jgi:hypothetical protein
MSQSAPLRVVPPPFESVQVEPPSQVPNDVRSLPRLVLPDTRLANGRAHQPVSLARRVLPWAVLLLSFGLLVFASLLGWTDSFLVPSPERALVPAPAQSGQRCDGSNLQSRMCEVAWQGSMVNGLY